MEKITDRSHVVSFRKNMAVVTNQNGEIKLTADRRDDLYYVREDIEHPL